MPLQNRFMKANVHIVASFSIMLASFFSHLYGSDFLASIESSYPETHKVTTELAMVLGVGCFGASILMMTGAALYSGWSYRIAIFLAALPFIVLQALYLDTGHSGFTFLMGCILVIPTFFSVTFEEAKRLRVHSA